jgi:hypothetical protein
MTDTSIVNLDPSRSDSVRFELGPSNWRPTSGQPSIPSLTSPGATTALTNDQLIDVLILGDGYKELDKFEERLQDWLTDFYAVDVYNRFAGAFRIRALFRRSNERCSPDRDSFYRVAIAGNIAGDGDDAGEVSSSGWETEVSTDSAVFRRELFGSIDEFALNLRQYPAELYVGGADGDEEGGGGGEPVIHNPLAGMYANLVVVMLVRTREGSNNNASGRTRAVTSDSSSRTVNVAFGSHALHEFGHAFAYLEDEYITSRTSSANRQNPLQGNVFTLSNLSFSDQLDHIPWQHLSPWGLRPRLAAGEEPSPLVGWLWQGGEQNYKVWHSEYKCLMNGKHENYAYSLGEPQRSEDVDLRFRRGGVDATGAVIPPRYCLWCQEIVTIRILEKTGQLPADDDPADINACGRRWYTRWVNTWRKSYWALFDVDQQIDARELLYANPASEPNNFEKLLRNTDGSYKRLDKSDLYRPYAAPSRADGDPPAGDEDVIQAMLGAF